jgi:predicted TIM-barrel fold metal-dependent hydrolase
MNTTDASVTGLAPVPNDHIAAAVRKYPDVFLGLGIIDPWQGKLALQEIRRCKEELGLHGIGEFNPARQHFFPNDLRFYPLWEEIQKQGLPVLFHSGLAAAGAGTREEAEPSSSIPNRFTRRCRSGLSRAANHLGASILAVAGGKSRHRPPQEQLLHRPLRLGAEIFSRRASAQRQHVDPGQGALRVRLARDHPRTLDK